MPPKLISLGQLIDDSWEVYRSSFHELLSVSSWLLILAIFYVISLSLYPSASALWNTNDLSFWENVGVILFVLTNYLMAPLIGVGVLIGLTRLVHAHLLGRAVNTHNLFREIKPLFLPTLFVSILVGCFVVFAMLIGFGPGILFEMLGQFFDNGALFVTGGLLLIVGAFASVVLTFRWMIEYMLAPYLMILDHARGKKALIASRGLVKGRFWQTFFRLVVPKLVYLIFGVFIMAIISYFAEIVLDVTGGFNVDLTLRLKTLIEWIIPVVIAVLLNPLVIITDLLLLGSLKDTPA